MAAAVALGGEGAFAQDRAQIRVVVNLAVGDEDIIGAVNRLNAVVEAASLRIVNKTIPAPTSAGSFGLNRLVVTDTPTASKTEPDTRSARTSSERAAAMHGPGRERPCWSGSTRWRAASR